MITLYDVIQAISDNIDIELILHKGMTVHPVVKAYKMFTYNLYKFDNGEKELLFTHTIKRKALSDELDAVWEVCDKEYLKELIKWLRLNSKNKTLTDGI